MPSLYRACRLISTAALLASAAVPGAAQEAVEIVVTPSRFPSDAASDEPVSVVTADDIARSGATTLDEVLNKLPSFGSQGVNASQNDGGYGGVFVDLRNLNFNRTLVLVDGDRFVLSGIRTDEAVDLNNIPLALVDHVEVLRDGAQPEYGSDGVAGVVNVVLKKRFDGLQLSAYSGAAGAGDDATETYAATWGGSFDGGSVAVDLGFTNRDPIRQSNRDWSRDPITGFAAGGAPLIGSSASPSGHATTSDGALDALLLGDGRHRQYDPRIDGYDDAGARYLQSGLRRYNAGLIAHYDIADGISADAQLLFTERRSDTLLPPQSLGVSGTGRYPDGFVVPATNPYNPFGQDVTLQRVLSEAGDQMTHTEGPTWRVVLGLQGELGDDADWRVSFNRGESRLTYRTSNAIDLSDVFSTLTDGSANYFGPDTLTPANVARIRYTDVSSSRYLEDVGRAVVHESLAKLPGGPLEFTLGAELRAESGRTTVSPVEAAGVQAGGDMAPTGGGYDTREAFVDLDMPVLKDRPFARVLSAEASARFTDTSRFGSYATYKAVATWAPDDAVRLRTTFGGARRPPAITEAFGGIAANYVPLTDPCDSRAGLRANPVVDANCRALGLGPGFVQAADLVNVASGGNPNLRPEASENMTLGAVLTPMPDLSLAVDYYSYRIKNAIDSLADTDPDYIPDACFESVGLSNPLCSLIRRAPSGAGAGQIDEVLALDANIGTIKTSGVDFDLGWRRRAAGGAISLDWQTTWLLDYRISRIGSSGYTQYAGTFPSLAAVGSYARVRSALTFGYARDDWSASWTTRLISGAKVLGGGPGEPFSKAPDVLYHDLSATWRRDRLTFVGGIENLLDQKPPTLLDGVTNTDTNTYDVVGRFLFVRCTATF